MVKNKGQALFNKQKATIRLASNINK